MKNADVEEFFEDIDDVDTFDGRAPRLGLGNYVVEVVNMGIRYSKTQEKDYTEILFKILESDASGFPVGSEACIQVWPAKFKIHLRKIKSFVEAALPGVKVTAKLCGKIVSEDLLAGHKLRIRVQNNAKGYPEPAYSAA